MAPSNEDSQPLPGNDNLAEDKSSLEESLEADKDKNK